MNDYFEIKKAQERLEKAIREIRVLSAAVGHAKQVREYDSDRRKSLLARHAISFLKAGHSVGSAETYARASGAYQSELEALSEQREASEKVIAQSEATFATFEAARSLLSIEKEALKTIDQ